MSKLDKKAVIAAALWCALAMCWIATNRFVHRKEVEMQTIAKASAALHPWVSVATTDLTLTVTGRYVQQAPCAPPTHHRRIQWRIVR